MNRYTKFKILFYVSIIFVVLLFNFGRSLWHPIYLKVVGKKTESQVYSEISAVTESSLNKYFTKAGVTYLPSKITLIALKNERKLEVWAQDKGANKFIHSYSFTGYSGVLGPKLMSGDNQIPEGLYELEYLNPNSSYHLSVKINYPNTFDKEMAIKDGRSNLGGDIFIHGKSATVGCIPIGDKNIEELFTLIYRMGLNNVSVIISPNDFRISPIKNENASIKWLDKKYQNIKNELHNYTHN